ncbi:hypothetical protein Dimus_028415 [Dionaea muscipula]
MAAGKGKRKSSSILKMLAACWSSSPVVVDGRDMLWVDENHPVVMKRICTSDEDTRYWVAEPDIDRKASAFIAKFYEARMSDPESQTVI